ncbi:hypothetical protein ACVW0A_002538 [Pseudomonas sp. TE3610]
MLTQIQPQLPRRLICPQAKVEAQPMPPADDPATAYQGGAFVAAGPFGGN